MATGEEGLIGEDSVEREKGIRVTGLVGERCAHGWGGRVTCSTIEL